jgi:hypothetical protein
MHFTCECGGVKMSAAGELGFWSASATGLGGDYRIICADASSAKTGCLLLAKAIFHERGLPLPQCLSNPKWVQK